MIAEANTWNSRRIFTKSYKLIFRCLKVDNVGLVEYFVGEEGDYSKRNSNLFSSTIVELKFSPLNCRFLKLMLIAASSFVQMPTLNELYSLCLYEEFKYKKNRYINFYQFEIFAIKAAEKQRKY